MSCNKEIDKYIDINVLLDSFNNKSIEPTLLECSFLAGGTGLPVINNYKNIWEEKIKGEESPVWYGKDIECIPIEESFLIGNKLIALETLKVILKEKDKNQRVIIIADRNPINSEIQNIKCEDISMLKQTKTMINTYNTANFKEHKHLNNFQKKFRKKTNRKHKKRRK